MPINMENIPQSIKRDPAKLGAVLLSDKVIELSKSNKELKSLLLALWENRTDEHWCFEMSSTIEANK